MTPANAATMAALVPFVIILVNCFKSFLPTFTSSDQQDGATRLLAVIIGASLSLGVYAFTADHFSRQALGQALAYGAGAGFSAVIGFHGGTALLGAVRAAGPAPVAAPVATTPLIAPIEHDPLQAK